MQDEASGQDELNSTGEKHGVARLRDAKSVETITGVSAPGRSIMQGGEGGVPSNNGQTGKFRKQEGAPEKPPWSSFGARSTGLACTEGT